MANEMSQPSIGDFRWMVTLSKRADLPDDYTGVNEQYTDFYTCHANIVPVGTALFIQGVELGVSVTHRITIYWWDRLDEFTYVFRTTIRPDVSSKKERWKIMRAADLEGRRRFTILDCQIERVH
jgi:head-tail adaptor